MRTRTAQTMFCFLLGLLILIMLMGCNPVAPRERAMCAVEEVESETVKGVKRFEVDFKNGKEQAISEIQYNVWKKDLPATLPCP